MTIGFQLGESEGKRPSMAQPNKKGHKNTSIYKNWEGKPGYYKIGAEGVTGVLKEINFNEGYMLIQPSIVHFGEVLRLEKEEPTHINFRSGMQISRRPLREGDLENMVAKANKK